MINRLFIIILIFLNCKGSVTVTDPERLYDDIFVRPICIEGHTYYYFKNSIAIKLDDDGKPVKCHQKGN